MTWSMRIGRHDRKATVESSKDQTNETDSDEKACASIVLNPDIGLQSARHPANRCI